MGTLSRFVFGISPSETLVSRRGFRCDLPHVRERLESIGASFVMGYHAALSDPRGEAIARVLMAVDEELRGFAYEGAGMGLTLLDGLTPWRRDRFARFLAGPGAPHAYMVHVGAGWAHARLGSNPRRIARSYDPLLRWLVFDGWGFHDGYFHWQRSLSRHVVPSRLHDYAARAYDQGLGRAAWFVNGADPVRAVEAVAGFAPGRQADLWSGIGLAAAYAGGATDESLEVLHRLAGRHSAALAQGASFAAQARRRADNATAHTGRACAVLCGESAERAAEATTEALRDLPRDGVVPAYESWRGRVREHFMNEPVMA